VFINVKAGFATKVLEDIRKIQEVKQVHLVTGTYDVIAYVEAPDMKVLGDTLLTKIQKISGIDRTVTSICVPG
jgi:DNA-binding Lrp family transcriptional regulator